MPWRMVCPDVGQADARQQMLYLAEIVSTRFGYQASSMGFWGTPTCKRWVLGVTRFDVDGVDSRA